MEKTSRIFVAGHAGLIGSSMLRRLQAEGCTQLITATRSQLDLQDAVRVMAFFEEKKPEYVVLAAGRVGGIVENQSYPADFMDENLAIQLNVMKAAQRTGVTKLVLFGSSCMYPRDCEMPMAEEALLSAKPETTSLPYAVSKLAGTYMCLAYNKQYGEKRFIPLIPNSVYGQNDNFDPKSAHVLSSLISRFHEAKINGVESVTLWGSGSPRREFVYADDIADAVLHLLRQDLESFEFPMNVGGGTEISIKELAEAVSKVVGYQGRLEWDQTKPDGAPRKLLDSTRLRSSGWVPKTVFNEGLRNTYDWYCRHVVSNSPSTTNAD